MLRRQQPTAAASVRTTELTRRPRRAAPRRTRPIYAVATTAEPKPLHRRRQRARRPPAPPSFQTARCRRRNNGKANAWRARRDSATDSRTFRRPGVAEVPKRRDRLTRLPHDCRTIAACRRTFAGDRASRRQSRAERLAPERRRRERLDGDRHERLMVFVGVVAARRTTRRSVPRTATSGNRRSSQYTDEVADGSASATNGGDAHAAGSRARPVGAELRPTAACRQGRP